MNPTSLLGRADFKRMKNRRIMHKIRARLRSKQWSITVVAPGFVARSETIEAVRWARYRPVITLMRDKAATAANIHWNQCTDLL